MKSVKEETVKQNLCIGCGICKTVCPKNAIEMVKNKYGELNPKIDLKSCINCSLCSEFCPNTPDKFKKEALKVTSIDEPQTFGLKDANYYVAWAKNEQKRIECCSGGVVTALATHLLDTSKIDGVIHVERLWSKIGDFHYGARLSFTKEDIEENVSTAYQPIDFSDVLTKLENNKTYFMTGTPCVIRGIKKLLAEHNDFKHIKIITCALICSHNTNSQIIDFLAKTNKLKYNSEWKVNIRNKDNIKDADNYNNHFYTKKGDLLKINRFDSGWTEIWRSQYFAMNSCLYCSDFWGYEADISVKDAWGKWSVEDAKGKNILVVRNKELEKELFNADIEFETLSWYDIKDHQFSTSRHKQIQAENKNFKSIFSSENYNNWLFKNKVISMTSKFLFKYFGTFITRTVVKLIDKILTYRTEENIFLLHVKQFFSSIRKIFKYDKTEKHDKTKKILVAGGYGYGNTGDEAQCAETLKLLSERYPEYQIINLSPNVDYSHKMHPNYTHEIASRVVFYDDGYPHSIYIFGRRKNLYKKFVFFVKSILIYINAFFVKADLPTFMINAGCSSFLYNLKTASLLYFCGGGYLTGTTLSRLYEGILLSRVAHLFNVPVVMSGQTIGVWENNFNKYLAKWGFKYVNLITVRDEEFSLKDLKSIGLSGENYFATHDDALFCEKSAEPQTDLKNYVTINFHYFNMNEDARNNLMIKIHNIIKFIEENTNYNILFIPMLFSDKYSYDDYITKYPSERFSCYNYDYDFKKIRKVIADSKICITMKHHPIIFAMGEEIPIISLAYTEYYVHKNLGALMQYKQEKFSINFEDNNYYNNFINLFNEINNNYEEIKSAIRKQKEVLKSRKDDFLDKVDKFID